MKYCFLTTGTWDANASFVRLREFGNELIARGHDVSYIADDIPFNRDVLKLHPKAKIVLTPNPGSIKQLPARRRIVRELAPDYVHVLNPFAKAYLALASTGVKIVGDWDEWPARRPLPFMRHQMEVFLDRWLRNRSNRLIVASKYLQSQFKSKFDLDAKYIPYATYLQNHADGASPFTEPAAVYMGNLYAAYDHDLIFDAAVMLKQRGLSPKIAILGSGPDLEKWRAFVRDKQIDNVAVMGFVSGEELWRHLRHARVLLFPIRETLLNLCRCPSKTYAYAQTRRPIICNRVGEVAEVLGEKAIYVAPTPTAFADAIASATSQDVHLADIDYGIERHNWSARTEALLGALD